MTLERPPGATDLDFIRPGDIPFLSSCPLFGRKLLLIPLHDGFRFQVFLPQADGSLLVMQPLDMTNGSYVARAPAEQVDAYDPLATAVLQHFSFPRVIELQQRIHADVVNSLASLHRYFVLLEYANGRSDLADTRLVVTELEYAFANWRAFYDLAAEIVVLFRFEPQFSAAELRPSFRRILQKNDDELRRKFGVPDHFIAFLRARERSFFALRAIRDGVYHRGEAVVQTVFKFRDGFGISTDSEVLVKLKDLQIWSESRVRNNSIVSLLPLFEFLARDLLDTSEALSDAMCATSRLPDAIAAGYSVYFRSPLIAHVARFPVYRADHWLEPSTVLPSGSG
jgi:hypothetical protein